MLFCQLVVYDIALYGFVVAGDVALAGKGIGGTMMGLPEGGVERDG